MYLMPEQRIGLDQMRLALLDTDILSLSNLMRSWHRNYL